jgi:catechol 2,3-dioxygenase-like lactoylglutathione lyase family enzyme
LVVKAIRWLGVRTDRFDEMRSFVLDILGLRLVGESNEFLETQAANGDRVEVFGGPYAPQPGYQFAVNRVVAGFLVDDIDAAREELEGVTGVELLGELEVMENGYAWQHFRAPDGQVYELTFDPDA